MVEMLKGKRAVDKILNRFLKGEETFKDSWEELDDSICTLSENLNDKQLIEDANQLIMHHMNSKVRCRVKHESSECFAPLVVEAARHIAEITKRKLTKKHRYLLEYYLALAHLDYILTE